MPDFLIEHTPLAYRYPLLIKHLLHAPRAAGAICRVTTIQTYFQFIRSAT
jgi:hypothetical protein